jgi:hypothetical protein
MKEIVGEYWYPINPASCHVDLDATPKPPTSAYPWMKNCWFRYARARMPMIGSAHDLLTL